MKSRLLASLLTTIVLFSPMAATEFGALVGRDGATLAATQFKSQPFHVTGFCDLRSGEHFVLRLKAGYGVLLYQQSMDNGLFETKDRSALDALRIQAAPCAEAALTTLPLYVRAGVGCGFHMNWVFQEHTEIDEGSYALSRVGGLDVTALAALGIRMSRHFALELGAERMLVDWSLTTKQSYTWDYVFREWQQGSHSSGATLNWNNVLEPGYSVGVVWTL
jgi:hypothetical protein